MTVKLLLISFFFLLLINPSRAADTLGLSQCIEAARKNSLLVKGAFVEKQRSVEGVSIAKNNYLPSVMAAGRNSYNWGLFIDPSTNILTTRNNELYSGAIEGEIELFNGGYNYYFLKEQEELLASATSLLEASRNDAAVAVTVAYYTALLSKEQVRLARALAEQAEAQTRRVKGLAEGGALPYRDYLITASEQALRETELLEASNNYEKSLLLLKQIMGLDEGEELFIKNDLSEIPDQLPGISYDSLRNSVNTTMPQLEAVRKLVSASRFRYKQIQALRYPSLALTGGVITRSSSLQNLEQSVQFRRNLSEYVAFRLTVPIFNKFFTGNQLRLAKLDAELNEIRLMQEEDDLQRKVQAALLDFQSSHTRYLATGQKVKALEQQFEYGEKAFYTGVINISEFNYIYNLYNSARIQHLQARYQFLMNRNLLEYYKTGQFSVQGP